MNSVHVRIEDIESEPIGPSEIAQMKMIHERTRKEPVGCEFTLFDELDARDLIELAHALHIEPIHFVVIAQPRRIEQQTVIDLQRLVLEYAPVALVAN